MKKKLVLNGDKTLPYLLIFPALILLTVFMLIPLVQSLYLSFFKWNGIVDPQFVGANNYTKMFADPKFWEAIVHTLIFASITVFFTVLVGLLLATVIDRQVRGASFFKFVFFISVMLSSTVVSVLFTKILEPNFGLLNSFLNLIGLGDLAQSWLGDPRFALGTVICINIWQYSGFTMILFLAAMAGISPSVHEAATLDGATEFQRLRHVTIPGIKRSLLVVIMLQIIFSFKSFDTIWIMTKGGPGSSSEVISSLLYKTAFQYQDYGRASAIAIAMVVLIGTLSLIYQRFSKVVNQELE